MKKQDIDFYSGTSGLVLPTPKHSFPPQFQDKSRLEYYAILFNSVEINSSFYKLPRAVTVQKWADSVGDEFRFTFKLWREVTHNKEIAYDPANIKVFMEAIGRVGNKRGSLLIQFPPSVKINQVQKLGSLLADISEINANYQWDVAVEFRDRSWYRDEVYQMLEQQQMAMVIHDKASSNSPLSDFTGHFVYLRFHGPDGSYRGTYENDFLYEYAQYISEWLNEGKRVYCYFNNTMGAALNNLQTLNKYVKELQD